MADTDTDPDPIGDATSAAFDAALDSDEATPPLSPEDDAPPPTPQGNSISQAFDAAYDDAIANGTTPQEAFQAGADAAGEVAVAVGIPAEDFELGMTAAQEAFNAAIANGATPEDALQAAGNAGSQATRKTNSTPDLNTI